MTALIGTSGWQYRHWIGRYYPRELRQDAWLERYAADFATVELNVSFYHLPKPEVFAGWAARTPADFTFAVKASRYLTHIRRLREPKEPVERLMNAAGRLGSKLGPVLLQLPPSLERDAAALDETLAAFPRGVRVAVEFRHESWTSPDVDDVLAAHGAAACLTDRDGARSAVRRTAAWTYLRFHSGCGSPRPCYDPGAIEGWARSIAETWPLAADSYVYFNNDPGACALRDAALAGRIFPHVGLPATRTPDPASIAVG